LVRAVRPVVRRAMTVALPPRSGLLLSAVAAVAHQLTNNL
jgi:hypothetical protein